MSTTSFESMMSELSLNALLDELKHLQDRLDQLLETTRHGKMTDTTREAYCIRVDTVDAMIDHVRALCKEKVRRRLECHGETLDTSLDDDVDDDVDLILDSDTDDVNGGWRFARVSGHQDVVQWLTKQELMKQELMKQELMKQELVEHDEDDGVDAAVDATVDNDGVCVVPLTYDPTYENDEMYAVARTQYRFVTLETSC